MDRSQPSALIAHSQGGVQAYYMMTESERDLFDYVILISPAMNRNGWKWEDCGFKKILVVYNPDDLAIWMGSLLAFRHPFGKAGCRGFKTDDPRFDQREDSTGKDGFLGHNHYFDDAHSRDTADMIDLFLESQATR